MHCKIIQDLLPLYHDGVCSEESRAAVEEHLADCGDCRRILTDMAAPLPAGEGKETENAAAAVKKIAEEWRRGKWKSWLKGAAAAAAACLLLVGLWLAATELYVFPVAEEKIQISDVRQLSDGRILYHLYIDDNRSLHRLAWAFSEEGDMYFLPKRSLYTERRQDLSPADSDQDLMIPMLNYYAQLNGFDTEIVRVWYGQGEDAILVWEEGMDLPAASQHDEEVYGFFEESAEYWAERQS